MNYILHTIDADYDLFRLKKVGHKLRLKSRKLFEIVGDFLQVFYQKRKTWRKFYFQRIGHR